MTQRDLARAVTVAITVLGAIQLADPATLGVTPEFKAWVGILATALGALAGFLPKVQGSSVPRGRRPAADTLSAEEIAVIRQALPKGRQ